MVNWTDAAKAGAATAEKNLVDAAGRLTNAIDSWEYDPSITPTGAVAGISFLADLAEDRHKLQAAMTGQTTPSSAQALGAGSSNNAPTGPNPAEAELLGAHKLIEQWVLGQPGSIAVVPDSANPGKINIAATMANVASSFDKQLKDAGTKNSKDPATTTDDADKAKKIKEASDEIAEGAKTITKGLGATRITADGAKKVQEGSKKLADLVK